MRYWGLCETGVVWDADIDYACITRDGRTGERREEKTPGYAIEFDHERATLGLYEYDADQ